MRRLATLVVATLLTLVVSTGVAAAHAKLESMTPADGATVADPPKSVVLRFNEPVGSTGAELVVRSPSGAVVSTGQLAVLDGTVTQPLAALTEAGRYQVAGRIVSVDGHPITVTGSFTVTRPAARTAGPPPAAPPAASTTDDSSSARVVIFAMGLVMLVVVALAVVIVRRRPMPGPGPE